MLYFPEGAKSLETHNFLSDGIDKTQIKAIIFPEGFELVKNLSSSYPVFGGYTGLKAVYCPESLTSLCAAGTHPGQAGAAFKGCTELKYVKLSNRMKILPFQTFMNCSSLVNVNIPSELEVFGGSAFSSDTMLRTVLVLPKTVTQLGNNIISGKNVSDGLYVGALNAAHQYNGGTNYAAYGSLFSRNKQVFAGGTALTDCRENTNYTRTAFTAHSDMSLPQTALMINGLLKYENMVGAKYISELVSRYCTNPNIDFSVNLGNANSAITLTSNSVAMSLSDIGYIMLGDVNGDGAINILDFIILKKKVGGISVIANEIAADVDCSGETDNLDLVLLRKYLLGVIEDFSNANPYSVHENGAAVSDAAAEKIKIAARSGESSAVDELQGTVYYVSELNGSDLNDGRSPQTAWRSLEYANKQALSDNGALLFERGGTYRGRLIVKNNNLLIGAYGEGENPKLYASAENYAAAGWTEVSENLWQCNKTVSTDVGNIVFDGGDKNAFRLFSEAYTSDLQYYYDAETGYVRLYSLMGSPSERFGDIEFCVNANVIGIQQVTSGTVIENLIIRYAGGHGISGNNFKNVSIRGCEIGWVGGARLGDGTTRYGNAIETFDGCNGFTVENCFIYQCYDTGLSFQGSSSNKYSNIYWGNNLIERCTWGLEWWVKSTESDINGVLIENNVVRLSGYGWSVTRREEGNCAIIQTWGHNNPSSGDFVIKNNIFDTSVSNLFVIASGCGISNLPLLEGNIYIQESGVAATAKWGNSVYAFGESFPTILIDSNIDRIPVVYFR